MLSPYLNPLLLALEGGRTQTKCAPGRSGLPLGIAAFCRLAEKELGRFALGLVEEPESRPLGGGRSTSSTSPLVQMHAARELAIALATLWLLRLIRKRNRHEFRTAIPGWAAFA
jgi:hypothetical protein